MDFNMGSGTVQNSHTASDSDRDQRSCACPYLLENTQNLVLVILFYAPHPNLREKLKLRSKLEFIFIDLSYRE